MEELIRKPRKTPKELRLAMLRRTEQIVGAAFMKRTGANFKVPYRSSVGSIRLIWTDRIVFRFPTRPFLI